KISISQTLNWLKVLDIYVVLVGAARPYDSGRNDGADIFVFDLADLGAVDQINDFNIGENDQIYVLGASAYDGATFTFEDSGRFTHLNMTYNGTTTTLFDVLGSGQNDLVMDQSSQDLFIFA
ncbi:hypothetical protein, partial [Roseobacter sp.]|uniref:hypothetical protein n=1 Tax=Roseobacter sp. TaxID=1907202 RepID=UPI003296C7D1